MEKIQEQESGTQKFPTEYKPEVLDWTENDYWKDFNYWWTIQQLRPWIEVEDTWWKSLYASISWWLLSVLNNSTTIITWFSTKIWDISMTAIDNQITITQTWNYILSAFTYTSWNNWNIIFRILKNWVSLWPHYRQWPDSTELGRTAPINVIQTLLAGDVLTLSFFQNSWWTKTLQSTYLAVSKL
jgi:hypothetical protein